jgi:hypothetical protein
MDEVYIKEAMLMSSISRYPIALDDTWAVWNNLVITKRMALAFLTKLNAGPLPRHLQEVLYADYSKKITSLPKDYQEPLRQKGSYWNFHTRQRVLRDTEETEYEWFSRLYGRLYSSLSERTTGVDFSQNDVSTNVVALDPDYKKQAMERLFLNE